MKVMIAPAGNRRWIDQVTRNGGWRSGRPFFSAASLMSSGTPLLTSTVGPLNGYQCCAPISALCRSTGGHST